MADKAITKTDTWLDKINKLIPVEATGVCVALQSFIGVADVTGTERRIFMIGALVVSAALVVVFLWKVYNVADWRHYVVSVLAMLVWAYNVNPDALDLGTAYPSRERLIAAMILIVFSTVAPLFVPPLVRHPVPTPAGGGS